MINKSYIRLLKYLNKINDAVVSTKVEHDFKKVNSYELIQTIEHGINQKWIEKNFLMKKLSSYENPQEYKNHVNQSSILARYQIYDIRISTIGRFVIVEHTKELWQVFRLPIVAIVISVIALIFSIADLF